VCMLHGLIPDQILRYISCFHQMGC